LPPGGRDAHQAAPYNDLPKGEDMRRTLLLPALAALWLPAAAVAQEPVQPGNPATGHEVARQACAGCHQIGANEGKQEGNAPSFADLAKGTGASFQHLLALLQNPKHPKISQPLTEQQANDVAVYIHQLPTGNKP
jgi:mono/diheme cytochrome c family protein